MTDFKDLIALSKYFESMKYLGVDFGVSSEDQLKLQRYNDVYESILYTQEDALKVVLYHLNKELVSKFQASIDDVQKYVLYDGHYPSIWALLVKMGLTSNECLNNVAKSEQEDPNCFGKPVYSSSLVFKVVTQNANDDVKYVNVIYNGNDVTKRIKKCEDGYCKLDEFLSTYLNVDLFENEDEFDRKCQNYDVHLNSKLIALAVACLIFGIIMLLVFIKLLKQKLKRE